MTSLVRWQWFGFVFTSIVGTLLHFIYALFGKSIILAPFSAVNESTWEHMKILFVPMFIFAIIESKYLKGYYENFWSSKLIGILIGLVLMPVIFYTYTGVFGKSIDFINIAIFFICAAAAYFIETVLLKNKATLSLSPKVSFAFICVIAAAFIVATFIQPDIPLFIDSSTGKSGIK